MPEGVFDSCHQDGDYVEASFGDTLNDARYDRGLLSGII